MQLSDRSRQSLIFGGLFVILGLGFLLASEGLLSFGGSLIWPVILISIGLNEILGRSGRRQLERARSRQLATAEERVRIARELHDIVAHSVSVMTVQIAAARRVASKDPAAADQALGWAEHTGRQSLDELRRIVNVLRSRSGDEDGSTVPIVPLPGLAEIPALIDGMRAAGLNVTFRMEGEAQDVTPTVGLTAYRVMQEALTNVLRHAPAAKAQALLSYDDDEIEVRVIDDGAGVQDRGEPTNLGHGILGMRERLAAVGGEITVGPNNGGWIVHAAIPVEGK
ncbi:MAG: sensor histidine kinase [Actinobacteria bacterium]|nr:sensor histidine kinase [Actinomycetota bacterium]